MRRVAGVVVEVLLPGIPGQMAFRISNLGPEALNAKEAVAVCLTGAKAAWKQLPPGTDEDPMLDDDQIIMAKLAYAAYGQTTDFKNYQGNPMPNWDDLGDAIQGAWIASAVAVANYLTGPPAADQWSPDLAD